MNDDNDIYERILHHLFDKRNGDEYTNLFKNFTDVDKILLRKKARELREKGLLDFEENTRHRATSLFELADPLVQSILKLQRWRRENILNAKITLDGVNFVKQHIINQGRSSNDRQIIEIIAEIKQPDEKTNRKMTTGEIWTIILTVVGIVVAIMIAIFD